MRNGESCNPSLYGTREAGDTINKHEKLSRDTYLSADFDYFETVFGLFSGILKNSIGHIAGECFSEKLALQNMAQFKWDNLIPPSDYPREIRVLQTMSFCSQEIPLRRLVMHVGSHTKIR